MMESSRRGLGIYPVIDNESDEEVRVRTGTTDIEDAETETGVALPDTQPRRSPRTMRRMSSLFTSRRSLRIADRSDTFSTEEDAAEMGVASSVPPNAQHPMPRTLKRMSSIFNSRKSLPKFMRTITSVDPSDFPMKAMTIDSPFSDDYLYFNPATCLVGVGLVLGLTIWGICDPEGSRAALSLWRQQSVSYFTWFYIGTRPIFTFFILYVAFRFGNIRLGPPNSRPEYSDSAYFSMLFASGVAIGVFFYGVSEPLWHQASNHYANAGYRTQDEIDMYAINQTLFHWGLAGWCAYVIVGLASGLAAYRFGLPLTFRSGLYTIFREYTWGWIGDLCDVVAIVVTVAGICVSLGLGAIQITTGLLRLGVIDAYASEEWLTTVQVIVIWCITAIATGSVLAGVSSGIKHLSNVAFFLGIFLLFAVLCLDKTSYQLNLITQSIGYYFQYNIFLVNFWTDAFGQLHEGEGRAIDDNAADSGWMDSWTVLYMAWWTSWAGFVGLFIARISKGRTVRSVVLYSLFCPLIYSFIWFCCFGGVGLRQARQALELQKAGEDYFGNPGFFEADTPNCFKVPQEDVVINGTTVFTNYVPGVTPVCYFSPRDSDNAWFNVMYSFSYPNDFATGLGPFLTVITIVAIGIYFITASNSGSLVLDFLATNGRKERHWLQRIFWGLAQGAVTSALLLSGGSQTLQALQAVPIVSALPFTVLLLYMMCSIYTMCNLAERNEMLLTQGINEFATPVYGGIFNIFELIFSMGKVHPDRVDQGMDKPTMAQTKSFFVNLFLPSFALNRIFSAMYPKESEKRSNMCTVAIYSILYLSWITLFCAVAKSKAFIMFSWTFFFVNGFILMNTKSTFRGRHNISGTCVGDFISSAFFYPCVLWQLEEQSEIEEPRDEISEEEE